MRSALLDRLAVETPSASRDGDRGGGVLRVVRALQRRPVAAWIAPRSSAAGDARALVELVDRRDRRSRDGTSAILGRDHRRRMAGRLHLEQPRLGRGIAGEAVVAVEMVGRDVEQHRDVAVEAMVRSIW